MYHNLLTPEQKKEMLAMLAEAQLNLSIANENLLESNKVLAETNLMLVKHLQQDASLPPEKTKNVTRKELQTFLSRQKN